MSVAVAAGVLALLLGGCSTPGPVHLYSLRQDAEQVHDVAVNQDDPAQDVPSYLEAGDRVTGFAYDPFTDHFFLRLAPGNHVRVVDRPARKIKREFTVDGVPESAGGDLAVSPRDGHVFLVDPTAPELIETTRLGKWLRRIPLRGRTTPATGIAFDAGRDELLALGANGRTVERYTRDGAASGTTVLDRPVSAPLGFDWEHNELYAPLAVATAPQSPERPGAAALPQDVASGVRTVGVFDGDGRCVRTIVIPSGDTLIDVGPHSFFRMF